MIERWQRRTNAIPYTVSICVISTVENLSSQNRHENKEEEKNQQLIIYN